MIIVMIQNFRTDKSRQTVQTQIRLLLEEQSDQGPTVCFSICIFLTKYPNVWPLLRLVTAKFSGIQKLRNFMVPTA